MSDMFGKKKEKINGKLWDWENFKTTEGFPISESLLDWVIGQDKAMVECKLCIDEWINKLKCLKKKQWWKQFENPLGYKPQPKELMPAGPFLFMVGDAGTGKSLIGRALSNYMTKLYKKHQLSLHDVLAWENKIIPSEPKISIHKAGEGKEVMKKVRKKGRRMELLKTWGTRLFCVGFVGIGIAIIGLSLYMTNKFLDAGMNFASALSYNAPLLGLGGMMTTSGIMVYIFSKLLGGNMNQTKGISGASSSKAPKLIIDNSSDVAPFVDATGHGSSQLFGSIAWDPYQTGGLGCYSMDTSVVTIDGIKSYDQLKIGDKVLAFNPLIEEIEEKKILSIHQYIYLGPMHHYHSKQVDLLVTPNHKIFLNPSQKKNVPNWRVLESNDNKYYQFKLPVKGSWKGKITKDIRSLIPESIFRKHNTNILSPIELGDFLELIGWFVSDGHLIHNRKYVCITQLKKRRKTLFGLLEKMNLKYTNYNEGQEIIIPYNQLYLFFKQYCVAGKGKSQKRFPPYVLSYPQELLKRLFNGLVYGDGSKNKKERYWYFSTSIPEIRNSFIILTSKLGLHCTFKERRRKPQFVKSLQRTIKQTLPNYQILIQENSQGYIVRKNNFEIIKKNKDGFVWCPVIEDLHNLLVVRNGKMCYSGNTPEHQRVSAGDVHRAHMGILFIDEIKNLNQAEAVTLLTVLEDGQLPITLRSSSDTGNTAAMAVATEPVPCMTFLVAAGNFDSLPLIHHALMDRIYGYGKVVSMNNEMDNTVENRRKYVQFIAQEVSRFHLMPFSREACEELINEGRRKSGFNKKLTTKFRPMISIIKTASVLAMNEKKKVVEAIHVVEAVNEHCKTIQKQLLEHWFDKKKDYIYIEPIAKPRKGKIHCLYIRGWEKESVGDVGVIKASMIKHKNQEGYFKVTGINNEPKWISDSIAKVRHIIESRFNIDPAMGYSTMIDFQQQHNVDGSSAGITMVLVLASIIEKKKIRQNIVVTGEINIDSEGKIIITPIGGVDQKIRAAMHWGFKKVVIPKKNLEYSIKPSDYKGIEIIGAETLEEYMDEVFE